MYNELIKLLRLLTLESTKRLLKYLVFLSSKDTERNQELGPDQPPRVNQKF